MARRYTLDTKIDALNKLDACDGDVLAISEDMEIPASTLTQWRSKESDLRRTHHQKQQRLVARQKTELQMQMIDRGLAIVAQMDDETLASAPLNQLATTLNALVSNALKLEEVLEETDEQEEKEQVIRFEYLYDGSVHKTPPWAGASEGFPRKIQNSSVRETMGQNGTGKNDAHRERNPTPDTWLVDDTDVPDVESSLAGFEDELDERNWYHD